MKTRIEFGSDHVSIICSRTVANFIGSALHIACEDWNPDDELASQATHAFNMGTALNQGDNFEEEEPTP